MLSLLFPLLSKYMVLTSIDAFQILRLFGKGSPLVTVPDNPSIEETIL